MEPGKLDLAVLTNKLIFNTPQMIQMKRVNLPRVANISTEKRSHHWSS
jgi:hypothetical protein